jgi:GGDEF domain-containing protein
MSAALPRPRRARPVADAPVAALAARAEDLAKGWVLELLESGPLTAAITLPAAEFAREAPALCAVAVRALASDEELDALRPGGAAYGLARRAGALTGASSPPDSVRAVGALRAVLWAAAREELRAPDAAFVEELAERLAHVAAEIALAAAEGAAEAAAVRRGAASAPSPPAASPEPGARPAADPFAVAAAPAADPFAEPDPFVAPAPPSSALAGAGARVALSAAVHAAHASGQPLAVLLAEIDGADRLALSLGSEAARDLLSEATAAIEGALPGTATARLDGPGRLWILAPGQGRLGGGALAARATEALAGIPAHGVPLTATIGIAVHPVDGASPAGLAARAEQALWAARAAGVRVGGADGAEAPAAGHPPL